jgi:hypothetical protein
VHNLGFRNHLAEFGDVIVVDADALDGPVGIVFYCLRRRKGSGVQGSGVQGFRGSGVQGFRVQGFRGSGSTVLGSWCLILGFKV